MRWLLVPLAALGVWWAASWHAPGDDVLAVMMAGLAAFGIVVAA